MMCVVFIINTVQISGSREVVAVCGRINGARPAKRFAWMGHKEQVAHGAPIRVTSEGGPPAPHFFKSA